MAKRGSRPLQRAAAAIDVLAAAREGMTVSEIALALDLPKPTVSRLVRSLVEVGYAQGAGPRARYRLGPRFHRQVQFSLRVDAVESTTMPVLQSLAETFKQTSYMARLAGASVDLAAMAFPDGPPGTLIHPGEHFPTHATAAGKVICAFQREALVDEMLSGPLEAYRPSTIVDPARLRGHLAEVRRRGYAIIDDELDESVFAVCCPVDVEPAGVLYAVGVVGLKERLFARHDLAEVVRILRAGASTLSNLLARLG